MATIKALNSLLDDIQVLEDITEKKLELIGEARRVLEMKLRKLSDEEKGVSAGVGRNAENPDKAVDAVDTSDAVTPVPEKLFPLSVNIASLIRDNPNQLFTSQTITDAILTCVSYAGSPYPALHNRIQGILRSMRLEPLRCPHLSWVAVPRHNGSKGTTYQYCWKA